MNRSSDPTRISRGRSGPAPLLAVAVASCAVLLLARAASADETDKVMSAWVVNFARFSEWPASKFENATSPIVIAVMGRDGVEEELKVLGDDVTVGARPVRVRAMNPPNLAGLNAEERVRARAAFLADLRRCHVLYIATSDADDVRAILEVVEGHKVLTVSAIRNFAAAGGMLGLAVRNSKVAFDANVEVINASGVSVSSKVLRLARLQKTEK